MSWDGGDKSRIAALMYERDADSIRIREALEWRDRAEGEVERLRRQQHEIAKTARAEVGRLRDALAFYADPATWNTISPHGTVTMNTPAKQDSGERARRALNA